MNCIQKLIIIFMLIARLEQIIFAGQQAQTQPNTVQLQQRKAQAQAKIQQVKGKAQGSSNNSQLPHPKQQATKTPNNSSAAGNQNDVLINKFVQDVNAIPEKSDENQSKSVEKASQAYQELCNYNKMHPEFSVKLSQKQKDMITESSQKLSQFKNLKNIINHQKSENIDGKLIESFIESVDKIPFDNKKDIGYQDKLKAAVEIFKKYMQEVKNEKIISKEKIDPMIAAMKKFFGSITKQQALEYGLDY